MTLVAIYAAVGFWVVPRIIASQLTKRLPPLTHRHASVGRVEVNPFQLTLTVSNLTLMEPGGGTFASWERFHADLEFASLWKPALVLSQVEIVRPELELERRTNGSFNVSNLIPSGPSSTSTNPLLPAIVIQHLRVKDGRIALRDLAIPGKFEKVLSPIDLSVTNLTTRQPEGAPGHLRVESSTGELMRWDGEVALHPPSSAGALKLGPVTIPRHGPYLNLATPANVIGGAVNLDLQYAFSWTPSGPDLVVSNLSMTLDGLAVQMPNATTTNLMLRSVSITDVSASLAGRSLRVGQLQVSDGSFAAQRGSDGSVDAAQAIRPEFIEKAVQTVHDSLAGWSIDLPEVLGERLELFWGDLKPESAVRLSALIERIQVQGLSNRTNQPVSVNGTALWGETGRARLEAEATLIPATATARLEFSKVRLPLLQPYVGEFVNLDVREGTVDGRWAASYNRQPGGPLLSVEGSSEVNGFLAFDTQAGRDFVQWESVEVRDVRGAWEPATLEIGEIHLRAPSSSFVLMTNGQFNLFSVVRTNPAPAAPAPSTSDPSSGNGTGFKVSITLDRLSLTNASLLAADETIPGQFSTTLQRFSGSLTDLSWPQLKKSRVELAGFVGPRAPFAVEGWVLPDPNRMFLDMHVTATNAELIPLTPYSIKFAGYPLKEGRMTADITYQVNGRQVQGENHVVVDRLTLGPKSPGKPVLDLPIRLGIALLKDSDGRITLDVPVRGSLDDPEFGVGTVVWQAVKGIFVKVATAPFKLLGSLFGGSEEDGQKLQTVEFAAGQAQLGGEATNRLVRLVTALNKRPELLVSVRAGVSPGEDVPALARLKLSESLRQLETNAPATNAVVAETGGTNRLNRLLFQLFTNTFPVPLAAATTATGTNGTPAVPTTDVPVAPPTPGQMEQQLLNRFKPTAAELSSLRDGRVERVKQWLLSESRLAADRLLLPDTEDTNIAPLLDRVVEFSLE